MKKRYTIAGTGTRAMNFARGLLEICSDTAELVGLYDINPKRAEGFCQVLGRQIPAFTDFADMVRNVSPDSVIITVTDSAHPELVEMCCEHNLEAVVEKPLAIDIDGIARILSAEKKCGKEIKVTFNMRFTPFASRVKELLASGAIGKILSGSAEWFIDWTHAREYFHRWHSRMECSGGLLVHKGTHHFDLLNWFVDDRPIRVSAMGKRQIFGDCGTQYAEYCRICPQKQTCWAAIEDIFSDKDLVRTEDTELLEKLYYEPEEVDGYIRDRCVFDKEIDIYDTMNVLIEYESGAQISYALNAYSPYQGFKFSLTGTEGRIEVCKITQATKPKNIENPSADVIRIITGKTRDSISAEDIIVPQDTTPHEGGDYRMFRHLFGYEHEDYLGCSAGSTEEALSALIGICANQSIKENRVVTIPSLDWKS